MEADADIYHPKEYWTDVAQRGARADKTGFAPVLHPDAPVWFNQLIDDLQFRAVRRALNVADVRKGARILDIGCGTGRWLRRYREMALDPIGIDATPTMIRLALERGTGSPVAVGQAQHLPFEDARFDCVSDITVVQHIPTPIQTQALGEMLRVLKPGGRLILMELIRGEGSHIFPRTAQGWIEEITRRGAQLLEWFGVEFLILDRLLVRAAQAITPIPGVVRVGQDQVSGRSPVARRVYWTLRHFTASLSGWVDPAVAKVVPSGMATHGVFVFRK